MVTRFYARSDRCRQRKPLREHAVNSDGVRAEEEAGEDVVYDAQLVLDVGFER